MDTILHALLQRRAIKVFDPVEIPAAARQQILDAARLAPSSFNMQPYRFYWIESLSMKKAAVKLCLGQMPAETASALVVAVADIGSLRATAEGQLAWMRESGFSEKKIAEYELKAKIGRWLFAPGWLGSLGALRWAIFRLLNLCKIIGMPPVSRQGVFKWATKNTSLACENLMIAAEALGFNTCPMDGFDGRRLAKFLGLSAKNHEIVMVIAVGKKSLKHTDHLQWRRPLDATVTIL
ncbi:MAG TPA: nitroreductase family protein [Terriglobales bacterium]|nr:nitroreductase family protein [Terriglobales bacterium]